MSDTSHFLFKLALTPVSTSSNTIRLLWPQEPMQSNAQIDVAWSRLRVNERRWCPGENTCSTAVDVAMMGKTS